MCVIRIIVVVVNFVVWCLIYYVVILDIGFYVYYIVINVVLLIEGQCFLCCVFEVGIQYMVSGISCVFCIMVILVKYCRDIDVQFVIVNLIDIIKQIIICGEVEMCFVIKIIMFIIVCVVIIGYILELWMNIFVNGEIELVEWIICLGILF